MDGDELGAVGEGRLDLDLVDHVGDAVHHLLTTQGFSHSFAAKLICFLHGFVLIEVYWLRFLNQQFIFAILFVFMLVIIVILRNMGSFYKKVNSSMVNPNNTIVHE